MVSLVISLARHSDLPELHRFLFENPHQNIRRRTRFEVKTMLEEGAFLIARRSDNHKMVATCYINQDPGEEAFEFGGAFVHPDFRGAGLFRAIGRVAITNFFLMHTPEQPLIAHVLVSNAGPRQGLANLGFEVEQTDVPFRPEHLPGLEHMVPDADGYVHADVLVFQKENYILLLQEELAFEGHLEDRKGTKYEVTISLPAWLGKRQGLREALRQMGGTILSQSQEAGSRN